MAECFSVDVRVDERLAFFTRGGQREIDRLLNEKTSVKDVLEACGIPHPEIDAIFVNGVSVHFQYVVSAACEIDARAVPPNPPHLQRHHHTRFVADGHLGKLTRRLRLLGLDVAYKSNATDAELLSVSAAENRALLTRDRRLLMDKAVRHGYFLRSQNADEQACEVIGRFRLQDAAAPFRRCIRCNGLLEPVSKAEVFHCLEPLTKKYYDVFRRCTACGRVYWAGSHFTKLHRHIEQMCGRTSIAGALLFLAWPVTCSLRA